MPVFTAVVERDFATGLLVGHVPGLCGAHTQGGSLEELRLNLREVLEMLHEDGELAQTGEVVGTMTIELG